jgi:predicted RecA/RadA family phage recombinase
MKNFVQPGDNLELIAPRALASGGGFLVGALFAVASTDAASGAVVEGVTRGVFDLPKAAGAITQGAKVYWDNAAFNVTTTATNNTVIGVATQAAASADATVRVKLNQAVPA